MPTEHPTILAIDPGTKALGFAVFKGVYLEYYGVKTFKRRSPLHALLADISWFITSLIIRYKPECFAIEQTFLIQPGAELLNVAAQEIKSAAKQHALTVYEYNPVKVRAAICQLEKATKFAAAQVIAEQFPELGRFLRRPTKWETLYWAHMFDAIAVGLVCLWEIETKMSEAGTQGPQPVSKGEKI